MCFHRLYYESCSHHLVCLLEAWLQSPSLTCANLEIVGFLEIDCFCLIGLSSNDHVVGVLSFAPCIGLADNLSAIRLTGSPREEISQSGHIGIVL